MATRGRLANRHQTAPRGRLCPQWAAAPAQPLPDGVLPADRCLAGRRGVRLALHLQRQHRALQRVLAGHRARRLHADLAGRSAAHHLRGHGRRDLGRPGLLHRRLSGCHQLHPEGSLRECRHRWREQLPEDALRRLPPDVHGAHLAKLRLECGDPARERGHGPAAVQLVVLLHGIE